MSEKRIIKKYPNRRLYDTAVSSYITLHDIKQLVTDCVNFQVIDAKTEEDLTNATLLQIILEQEGNNSPMFSREILENFIRYYGDSMQSMMSHYLQQSMSFFMSQQNKLKGGIDAFFDKTPMSYFTEMANQNLRIWQSLQESILSGNNKPSSTEPETSQDEK